MLSTTTTANGSSRSTSRFRREPVRFDPGPAATTATATATADNPTATTMTSSQGTNWSSKATVVTSAPKKKKAKTEATTTTTAVAKKKSAPWTAADDQRLRLLVEQEQRQQRKDQQQGGQRAGISGGIRWVRVAKAYGASRNSKQLRERWINVLDPSLKRGDWTEEETALVIRLQKELGNKWSQIATQLPGRTANCVKNKWNGSKKIRRAGIIGATATAAPAAPATTKATATAKNAAVITIPEKIVAPVDIVVVPHANYAASASKMPPTSPLAMSPSIGNEASPSANDYTDRDGYYPQDELNENAMPPALSGVAHHYVPPPVPSPVQEEPLPALGLPTIEAEPLSTEESIRHPHLFNNDNAPVPSTASQHDISIAEALLAMISPPTKEVSATPLPLADMTSPVGNMMSLQNWPGPSSKMPDASSPADGSDWFGPGVLGGAPVRKI